MIILEISEEGSIESPLILRT